MACCDHIEVPLDCRIERVLQAGLANNRVGSQLFCILNDLVKGVGKVLRTTISTVVPLGIKHVLMDTTLMGHLVFLPKIEDGLVITVTNTGLILAGEVHALIPAEGVTAATGAFLTLLPGESVTLMGDAEAGFYRIIATA